MPDGLEGKKEIPLLCTLYIGSVHCLLAPTSNWTWTVQCMAFTHVVLSWLDRLNSFTSSFNIILSGDIFRLKLASLTDWHVRSQNRISYSRAVYSFISNINIKIVLSVALDNWIIKIKVTHLLWSMNVFSIFWFQSVHCEIYCTCHFVGCLSIRVCSNQLNSIQLDSSLQGQLYCLLAQGKGQGITGTLETILWGTNEWWDIRVEWTWLLLAKINVQCYHVHNYFT